MTVAGHLRKIVLVGEADLSAVVDACRSLIRDRFHDEDDRGAAAMLLDDGTILTGHRAQGDQSLRGGLS